MDNTNKNTSSEQNDTGSAPSLFEWSAIHLGASLAEDARSAKPAASSSGQNGWETVDCSVPSSDR